MYQRKVALLRRTPSPALQFIYNWFGVEFIKIRPEEGERLKKFVKVLESTA
jgi:hypothetical protein